MGTRPSVSGDALGTTTTTTLNHHGSGPTTTTTTIAPASVTVVVANASSVSGVAAHYSNQLAAFHWNMQTPTNATGHVATSTVYYASGQQQAAASIAVELGLKPTQVLPFTTAVPVTGVSGDDVVVVIGADLANAAGA